jgi:RNA polymerase sigma-70 factor (family 1)
LNVVTNIKEGDVLVFSRVFHQFHQKLYYYVLSKTKSEFCAEEVVQITFIKLWQYRHSLNEDISIDAQLFRIAKTTLIDQLRKLDYSDRISEALARQDSVTSNKAISNLEQQELRDQLLDALSQMPPARKKVFEMSRLQGLSYKEIAASLFISEKTVENHIGLALRQLKEKLPFIMVFIAIVAEKKIF